MNRFLKVSFLSLFCLASAHAGDASFKRAIIVVLENTNYDVAIQQPIFAKLASEGSLFTQFMAEGHPSQPNYIAMIAGDTLGVRNDSPVNLNANHLGNLLTAKGLDWKLYAEDLPSNCFLGTTSGKYARKHVPFLSFLNVQQNPAECAKVVNASEFQKDLANNKVPAFSMYIPNLDNDGHDTGADYAAQWFSNAFGGVLSNSKFMKDTLIIVTFDESEKILQKNQVYTVMLGANVIPGSKVDTLTSHYSVLRTIEDNFSLGNLGKNDAQATSVKGIWQ
jgi:hypothetical protein